MPFVATDEHEEETFFGGDKIALLKGRVLHCSVSGFDVLAVCRQWQRTSVASRCDEFLRTAARFVNPLLPLLARQALRKIVRLLSMAAHRRRCKTAGKEQSCNPSVHREILRKSIRSNMNSSKTTAGKAFLRAEFLECLRKYLPLTRAEPIDLLLKQ
jgi:hypothetical protein